MVKKPAAIAAALGCAALLWCANGALAQDFRTGQAVELSRFAGSWYELARTPNEYEDARKTKGGRTYSACFNVRTEYTIKSPEKLRVRNYCSRQSQEGDVIRDVLSGLAIVSENSANRKLKVAFGSAPARALQRLFTGGGKNYWIYCVGPVNEKSQYDWAVTGGPKRRYVFLLARDKTVSERTKSQILDCARREGVPVERLMFLQR